MPSTFAAVVRPVRTHPVGRTLPAMLLAAPAVCLVAVLVQRPDLYRVLCAGVLGALLVAIALSRPALGALTALMFLPFLALVRRLLIPSSGWSSVDPLLLVGPLVAALLFADLFLIRRRRLLTRPLGRLVAGLLLLSVIQTANPFGAGLVTNVGGLLFVGVPLVWFFVGRELATDRIVATLLAWLVGSAFAVGLYGMWQIFVGFPSWDAAWLKLNGYSSLHVTLGVTRAFGTFSSSAEYAAYLSVALVVAVAMALHGRLVFAIPVPLLATALFLESSRGPVLITLAVAICLGALRTGNGRLALGISLSAIVLAIAGIALGGRSLGRSAGQSSNPLIQHQIGGIVNPTDPNASTLGAHLSLMQKGLEDGLRHPLGQGTGATTIAASQLGNVTGGPSLDQSGASVPAGTKSQGKNTETDLTNTLISLGVLGPILLVGIAIVAFRSAIRRYLRRPDPRWLAVIGVLLATFGNWLNGGEYAVAPLVMFLLGWTAAGETARAHEGVRPAWSRRRAAEG